MRRIQVSEDTIQQLRELRVHHPHPRVRQKVDAACALDFSRPETARLLGVTETAVRPYLKAYAEDGLDAILSFVVGGSVSVCVEGPSNQHPRGVRTQSEEPRPEVSQSRPDSGQSRPRGAPF